MPQFECDRCAACCTGALIVEADALDVMREPTLVTADPIMAGREPRDVIDELSSDFGRVLLLACGKGRPCTFLGADKLCSIYSTRPSVCVALQAGSEQCQAARADAGLPRLEPLDEKSKDREPHPVIAVNGPKESQSFSKPEPSTPIDYPKGYRWPASRLTSAEMMKLSILRNETKQPITKLLREAVDALWEAHKNGGKDSENPIHGAGG